MALLKRTETQATGQEKMFTKHIHQNIQATLKAQQTIRKQPDLKTGKKSEQKSHKEGTQRENKHVKNMLYIVVISNYK